jgi:hypothetical protein
MKENLHIFISQPMNGLSNEQIIENRNEAYEELREMFPECLVVIVDNLQMDSKKEHPLEYLGVDIDKMKEAKYVYFLEGFEKKRGYMVEFETARLFGIPMLFQTRKNSAIEEAKVDPLGMKTVFLAQPLNIRFENQFDLVRHAQSQLKEMYPDISFKYEEIYTMYSDTYDDMLDIITRLKRSQVAYFCKGWEKYKSSLLVFYICREFKVPMIFQS